MISAKKSAKTFMWTFLGSIIGFVNQLIVARVLGPFEYGRANLVIGSAGVVALILSLGFEPFITREVSRFEDREKASSIFSFFLLLALLIDSASLSLVYPIFLSYFSHTGLSKSDVCFAVILFFLFHVTSLIHSYLIGIKQQPKASFLRNFLPRILGFPVFLAALLIPFKLSYRTFLMVSVLTMLPIAVVGISNVTKPTVVRNFFKETIQFYVIAILYNLFGRLSKVLQGLYYDANYVGYLSLGIMFGNAGVMIGSVLATMAMPEFSYYWSKGDIHAIERTFKQVARWSAFLTLPVAVFLMTFIADILRVLGRGYQNGTTIILIVLAAQLFNVFVGPNGTLLNMSGNQRFEVINGIALIAVSTLLGVTLGPKQTWGIAFAFAAGIVVVNLLKMIEVALIYRILPYDRKTFFFISALCFLEVACMNVIKAFIKPTFWSLFSGILVGASFAFVSFLLSPQREDRELAIDLLTKLPLGNRNRHLRSS